MKTSNLMMNMKKNQIYKIVKEVVINLQNCKKLCINLYNSAASSLKELIICNPPYLTEVIEKGIKLNRTGYFKGKKITLKS